jgi:hypothetical protein
MHTATHVDVGRQRVEGVLGDAADPEALQPSPPRGGSKYAWLPIYPFTQTVN